MQTNEEHIEQQLWEYIDGLCDNTERARIATLITEGGVWKNKYEELQLLHSGIVSNVELEHPPMRFTKNVMDTIAKAYPVAVPKKYSHPLFIRGIAAFFIISICFLLAYTLFTADWSAPASSSVVSGFNLPKMELHTLLEGNFFNVIIGATVVLGLALLDSALRAKKPLHRS